MKNKNIVFQALLAIVFLSLYQLCAFAAESPEHSLLKKLNYSTFSANFEQSVVEGKATLQKSSGKVYIVRPGQFAWIVKQPRSSTIILQHNDLVLYEPELMQASYLHLNQKTESAYPAMLLASQTQAVLAQFSVQQIQVNQFELRAKVDNPLFKKLLLSFNNDQLQDIRIFNTLDQVITIHFSNRVFDQHIPLSQFHLQLPKGTDIVHMDDGQ